MSLTTGGLSAFFAAMALLAGAGDFSQTLQPLAAPAPLSGALAEVSGLAPASPTSVYAHNDEQATIYEIDIATGKTLRSVSLGRPPLIGDFEAIVAHEGNVALIESDGRLFESRIGPRRPAFAAADAGLDADCEVEGFARADDGYFIACKRAKGRLVIYRWAKATGARKIVDLKLKGDVPQPDDFRATDLAHDPKTNTFLVLDSGAGAILEVSIEGDSVGYWRLGGDHPQAEGLALMPDGRLIVADEGKIGGGRITGGKLTVYPPRR